MTTIAFEALLAREERKPKLRKQLMLTISLALHGVLLVVGIIHSFWSVEELAPPSLAVTLHLGAPPPPPPPPAARKATPTKPKARPSEAKADRIVAPKEVSKELPKEEPKKEEDEDKGQPGGVEGGVVGGVPGGAMTAVPAKVEVKETPKMVTPQIGRQQLLIDPERDEFKVKVPPALRQQDLRFAAILKICVSAQGAVTSVQVLREADPTIDGQFPVVMSRWRYKPYTIDGRPVPFCYPLRYEISTR